MKRSRLKPKSATERRSSRVRDEAYLAWLRLQPCAVGRLLPELCVCSGPIDPEHRREGVGMGMKASDRDAWPCCRKHHGDRHDGTGVFKRFTRAELNSFIRARIAEANARYDRELAAAAAS